MNNKQFFIPNDCWGIIKDFLINPLIPYHYIKSQPIMVTIDNNNVIKKITRREYENLDEPPLFRVTFVKIIKEIYYLNDTTNLLVTKYQDDDTQNIIKTTYKLVSPDYKIKELIRQQKLKFWGIRNSFNNKHLYSKKDWNFQLNLRFICYRQQQKRLTTLNTLTKFLVDGGQINTSNSVKNILNSKLIK